MPTTRSSADAFGFTGSARRVLVADDLRRLARRLDLELCFAICDFRRRAERFCVRIRRESARFFAPLAGLE
jgi:hypothetical protein